MILSPYIFKTLNFFGVYAFKNDKFLILKKINFFIAMLLHVYYLGFEIFIDSFADHPLVDFAQILFLEIMIAVCWTKIISVYFSKNLLRSLMADLRESLCCPIIEGDSEICQRSEKLAERIFGIFVGLMFFVHLVGTLVPQILYERPRALVSLYDPSQLPYNLYAAYYVANFVFVVYCTSLTVCCDAMTFGIMILIAGQCELFTNRIKFILSASNEDKKELQLADCIRHHLLIKKMIRKTQKSFIKMLLFFFFVCIGGLAVSTLALSAVSKKDFFEKLEIASNVLLKNFK